ncbi:MAG: DinB family protein [Candidatus Eisenbacteria bacterium]|nr:DinB family protein [Candidatus Eisenbacteria bacterium]
MARTRAAPKKRTAKPARRAAQAAAKRTRKVARRSAPTAKARKNARAGKRTGTGKPKRTRASHSRRSRAIRRADARRRAARRPPVAQAFEQTAGASPKQRLLFDLLRARTAVRAAVAGLGGGSGDQPIAPGKWSARETLLHLVTRDHARLTEMEAALRGTPASWEGAKPADWARINAETMAPIRPLSWEDTLRLLDRTRERLIEALESVPDDRPEIWAESHAFGKMFLDFHEHDRHHAEILKRWRTRGRRG